MRLIKPAALFTLLALLFIGGCNGPSDDSGDNSGSTGEFALSLSYKTLVDGQCAEATSDLSFVSNASICAVAKLTQGGRNSSGGLISFGATFGTLTPATKLTDSSGIARVILSNPGLFLGAGILTAQFDTGAAENNILSASRNYEFTSTSMTPDEETPKISASIINGAVIVTQFKVDETVQLQAQFLDSSSQGIKGLKVIFTAGNASLLPNSALTGDYGIAQVNYTPSTSDLGAASLNVSLDYQEQNYQTNSLYEVLSADAIGGEGILKLGHFDSSNNFVSGVLGTSLTRVEGEVESQYIISAGGSFGITATLISQADDGTITRVQTPASISFSSDCVLGNNASLDTPVTTLSGQANSTFQNTSCSGNSRRNDQIVATTQSGNLTLTAKLAFILESQALASLSFESAEPKVIRIKDAGGTGNTESSLVTFKVTGSDGQPIAQQQVSFSLDTLVGGLSFSNGQGTTKDTASSFTNSEGLASVRVQSGTVPTPVRVLASATDSDTGETITSQSEQLTVNTGLPQQLGFSLSASALNPEADQFNGEKSTITAYASDSFGNPAPDDTSINFTAEGGQIVPNCSTVNGSCSVEWTSTSPRVPNHRITILAYALGHETFFDTNGNNIFDDADGIAVDACLNSSGAPIACSGNGMDIEAYMPNGFSDLGDAFRDDDETGQHSEGEKYFNTESSTSYLGPDGKFNGPQCEGNLCGIDQANQTYIRKALVMTMSGSHADFTLWQDGKLISDDSGKETDPIVSLTDIAPGQSSQFSVQFYDSAYQIMPADSQVTVTASSGELNFDAFAVLNTSRNGGTTTGFIITNDIDPASVGEAPKTSNISIYVTTPKQIKSSLGLSVTLTGT
ncbi:Ig-like domain-containing protein [Shewanella benthica]|nr:Ig-like domain-containing protein [Shewanella benthica]